MTDQILPNLTAKFSCKTCGFNTSRQALFNTHLLTAKHKRLTMIDEKKNNLSTHVCRCGKSYKFKQSLHKHKKTCDEAKQVNVANEASSNLIILELLQQNNEFKEMLIEQNKNMMELSKDQNNKLIELSKEQNKNMMELAKEKSVVMTNSNNNSNNTHFNLQFFLNNTCKDAITADEFVDNIKITFDDLENVGNEGYVKGITDIIMKQLKTLDVTKRPFHCTDTKRETMYIKDEKEWNKDDQEKTKLKKVIAKVADKNYRKIPEWRQENPECKEVASQKYEFCIDMMRNSLGGLEEDQIKMDNKIIKAVAKEVYVETKN
jgi:hypothetical protein